MVTLRERHDPLRLAGRRLLLALLALLVVSAALQAWSVFRKERESAQLNADTQRQLAELQARQTALAQSYAALQTNRGVEEALRDQYAMGKNGEGLIVIVEPEQPKPVAATSSLMQWVADVFSRL